MRVDDGGWLEKGVDYDYVFWYRDRGWSIEVAREIGWNGEFLGGGQLLIMCGCRD